MFSSIIARLAIVLAVAFVSATPGVAGGDYFDNFLKLQRLQNDEARGGPRIVGGRSALQDRFRVCKVLPTPTRDPATGQRNIVDRQVCWFE